ncbi:MAG: cyclase family protein [Actinomycetota bacterium]
MSRYVDLSHPISSGEGAYRGMQEPKIGPFRTREQTAPMYDNKASFEMTHVNMVGNTGTYIDAPYHRFDNEDDLAMMPLEILVDLPITLIDCAGERSINVKLDSDEIRGHAVLFRTGWDRFWLSERYYVNGPFLGSETLDHLIGAATLVGVDFANVDDIADLARPSHTRLLAAGIPIIENMCNLAKIDSPKASLFAAPIALSKGASFPVRAFAKID